MNIEEMNIDAIEARLSEIETEKEAPEANFEALTEEVRALKEQKDKLIADVVRHADRAMYENKRSMKRRQTEGAEFEG